MLRRLYTLAALAMLLAAPAAAQTTSRTALRINPQSSAPATCNANSGEVYFDTVTKRLYRCTAANTWTALGDSVTVSDEAYDATSWNGSTAVPTKNAVRDKLESMGGGSPCLVYQAKLTQAGTAAPTATVGQNTLGGSVTWARVGGGVYTASTAGLFTANTTVLLTNGSGSFRILLSGERTDANTVTVYTWHTFNDDQGDDYITDASIRIESCP